MFHRIELKADADETGTAVDFTWDLFPLVPTEDTLHLDQDGLPKVGTLIKPGMILVGAIGKSRFFNPQTQPSALEIHGENLDYIKQKYSPMWVNKSFYSDDITGVVMRAFIELKGDQRFAVVEIDSSIT